MANDLTEEEQALLERLEKAERDQLRSELEEMRGRAAKAEGELASVRELLSASERRESAIAATHEEVCAEKDEIIAAMNAAADGNNELLRLQWEKNRGAFHIEMQAVGLQFLAAECRGILRAQKAPNCLELKFKDDQGDLLVTVQKLEGKSPLDLKQDAESERDTLRAELDRVTKERDAWKTRASDPLRYAPDCPPYEPDNTEPLL